jgi:hypothetical protein
VTPGGRECRWSVQAINRAKAIDSTLPKPTIRDLRLTAASLAVSAGASGEGSLFIGTQRWARDDLHHLGQRCLSRLPLAERDIR